MADISYTYKEQAAEIDKVAEGLANVQKSIESSTEASRKFASTNESVAATMKKIGDSVNTISGHFKKLDDVTKKTESNAKKLKTQYSEGQKSADKLLKTVKTLGLANTKVGAAAGFMGSIYRSANNMQRSITGIDLSLGGILKTLLEVVNIERKITGLSMQIAGAFGGTGTQIASARDRMEELRSTYVMSYDDAANLASLVASFGLKSEAVKSAKEFDNALIGANIDAANLTVQLGDLRDSAAPSDPLFTHIHEQLVLISGELDKGERILEHQNKLEMSIAYQAHMGLLEGRKSVVTNDEIVETEQKIADIKKQQVELTKQAADAKKEEAKAASEIVSIESEAFALSTKYGVGTADVLSSMSSLQTEYGKTTEQARALTGVAVEYEAKLRDAAGAPISVGELVSDWQEVIANTKIYKTDLLGVLSLQGTLYRTDALAKALKVGDKGLARSVTKNIVQGLVSAPLQMEFAWKARFGRSLALGKGPVASGMAFERLAESSKKGGEGFAKMYSLIVGEIKGMTKGGTKDTREFKARELLRDLNIFDENTVRVLAKGIAEGTDPEALLKVTAESAAAQKKLEEANRTWPTQRQELVNYAKEIAISTNNFQEILMRYLQDTLLPMIRGMYKALLTLQGSWLNSDPASKAEAKRKLAGMEATDKLRTALGGQGGHSPEDYLRMGQQAGLFDLTPPGVGGEVRARSTYEQDMKTEIASNVGEDKAEEHFRRWKETRYLDVDAGDQPSVEESAKLRAVTRLVTTGAEYVQPALGQIHGFEAGTVGARLTGQQELAYVDLMQRAFKSTEDASVMAAFRIIAEAQRGKLTLEQFQSRAASLAKMMGIKLAVSPKPK
jgi:hypothetical protein